MKARIIDKLSVASHRQPSDDVWRVYAHHLVTAFGDLLIQEGLSNEISQKLYCHQRIRELDKEVIESLLYTLPPAFIDKTEDIGISDNIHWGASKNSPFILLGHVGTGKSTFLDHNFLYKIPQQDSSFQAIIVNFLESEDNHDDFVRYLCVEVNKALNKLHPELSENGFGLIEKLFSNEIASYKATFKDSEFIDRKINELCSDYIDCHLPGKEKFLKEMIKRKIDYATSVKHKKVWIVLDNIDQHHSCLQNNALVAVVSLATGFGCSLVISMRYISLTTPAAKNVYLSYRPRKLKLSFPSPIELLNKRLLYFKELAREISNNQLLWTGYTLTVEDLIKDIEITISLLTDSSFMENNLLPLSNYNVRRMLEIILSVFQSYFFFYDRFNNNRYRPNKAILNKRFLQAHMLKNEDYFGVNRDDKESFVINLFENENKSYEYNQLIRIRLLQGLMSSGNSTSVKELTSLMLTTFDYSKFDLLQGYRAFLKSEIFAIKGDLNLNLSDKVFHEGFTEEHMNQNLQICITHAGRYHFELLQAIEYIEIMKYSTYIDNSNYVEIQGENQNQTIHQREISTNKFVNYISKEEKKELNSAIKDKKKFDTYFGLISPMLKKGVKRGFESIVKHSGESSFNN